MLIAALFGFVLGFVASIPVAGPISALVVTRGIEGRFRAGAFIALGGGVVEALYAFLAFWGFSHFFADEPLVIPISHGAGAVVLLALGITFARVKKMGAASDRAPRDSAIESFALGAGLCLINPTLIATWSGAVTMIYSTGIIDFSLVQAVPFALGVCGGIAGWFLILLWLIRRYKERFSTTVLARAVRVIGWLLIVLSLWFAVRFVQSITDLAPSGAPASPAATAAASASAAAPPGGTSSRQ